MAKESLDAKIIINEEARLSIIDINKSENTKKYKCTCCGDSWDNPKTHFNKSKSPLFAANDGYVNICYECRDKYYYYLVELFSGNEEKAIERMCQMFDWFLHEEPLSASKQISRDRSRVGHYANKLNLTQTTKKGLTYTDTIINKSKERENQIISSKEELVDLKNKGEISASMASAERWGVGVFEDNEYKILDDHYRMLKRQNPNCDSNQEIFIKSLCYLNLIQLKALKENNTKAYIDANSEYAKTFKQAGLKTIEEKDASNNAGIGVTLGVISQYTPEEFYKDKRLFEDYDKIGEYMDRHILRPVENLMTGNSTRDFEFFVPENSDEDD